MRVPSARFITLIVGIASAVALSIAITQRTTVFRAQSGYTCENCTAYCGCGWRYDVSPPRIGLQCGGGGVGEPGSESEWCQQNLDQCEQYFAVPGGGLNCLGECGDGVLQTDAGEDCDGGANCNSNCTCPQGMTANSNGDCVTSSSTGGGTAGTGGSSNGVSSAGSNGSQGSNGSNGSQGSQGSNGSQNSQNSQQSQNSQNSQNSQQSQSSQASQNSQNSQQSQNSQNSQNSQQSQNSSCSNCRQGSSPGSSAPSSRTSSVGPNNQSSATSCVNSVSSYTSAQRAACLQGCGASYMVCMEWARQHCVAGPGGEGANFCQEQCGDDLWACMQGCNGGAGGTLCSSASSSAPACTSDSQCLSGGGTQWTGCTSDGYGHCTNVGTRTVARCVDNSCTGEREAITQECAPSACAGSSSSSVCPAGYTCMSKEACVVSGQPNNGAGNVCGDSTTCCKDPQSNSSASSSSASLATCSSNEDCEQPATCHACTVYQGACVRDCAKRNPVCEQGVCVVYPGTNQVYFESCGANECTASSQSSVAISCQNVSDCPTPDAACTECLPGQGGTCARTCTNPQVACTNNRCVFTEGPPRTFQCDGNECTAGSSSSSSRQSCNVNSDCTLPYPSCTSCTKQGDNSCSQLCSFFTAECVNNLCDISEEVRVMSCNANQCVVSSGSSSSASSRSSSSSSRSNSSYSDSFPSSRSSRSSSSSSVIVGGVCDGSECRTGGSTLCAEAFNQSCILTSEFPCLTCSGDLSSSSFRSSLTSTRSSSQNSDFFSSSSSEPIVLANICDGSECATKGGDTFCGLQGLVCQPTAVDPCIKCVDPSSLSSSTSSIPFLPTNSSSSSSGSLPPGSPCTDNYQCSTLICKNGFCQPPLPPDSPCTDSHQCSTRLCVEGRCQLPQTLAFLGEVCTDNRQCVTNLCINNLCTACTSNSQCASSICQGGICLIGNLPDGSSCSTNDECQSGACIQNICSPKGTLPAIINGRPVFIPDPSLQPSADPSLTLPATVIELPFTENNGSTVAQGTGDELPSAPVTPSTGPAALAIMIAGGAAGWVYRKRRP